MIGNTNAVHISNVNKSFKVGQQDVWVLKDVSLSISYREFAIIFGPSGSGKSTILHIILGLEQPDTGDVEVMGLNIYDLLEEELCDYRKKFVGMIYQQANWVKAYNVIENVAFPLILQGVDKRVAMQRATEVLDIVGMSAWSTYLPTELSSGQQQKISLARALVTKPEVIIGDEPTGSMDLASSEELLQLLKKLSGEGKTIILVTHNSDNIRYATRVIRVLDGQIVKSYEVDQNAIAAKDQLEMAKEDLYSKVEDPIGKGFSAGFANKPPLDLYKKIRTNTVPKKFNLFRSVKAAYTYAKKSLISSLIVFIYILEAISDRLTNFSFLKRTKNGGVSFRDRVYSFFRKVSVGLQRRDRFTQIAYIDLVELAFRNMFLKRTRTIITVGGISIGIAFIVFLISIGYGIERLVMSRVATLDQLKQVEVTPTVSTNVSINDDVLSRFKGIQGVQSVYPVINIAGKVNFNNSSLDVVVFGTQKDYLVQTAQVPKIGRLFESNETTKSTSNTPADSIPVSFPEQSIGKNLVNLPPKQRELIVNETFLRSFGLKDEDALSRNLNVKFIVTGQLVSDGQKVETNEIPYKIVGILPEGETPVIYTPLTDLKDIGLSKYSLALLVARNQDSVQIIRSNLEALGFRSTSVIDTIIQIEALFSTVRILLGIVGMTALIVSTLGMFNTLTVSLLERTREVGLMKAIGMRSDEVQDLFVIESISMSILGGLIGIFIGVATGKILSLVLTLISQARGFDAVDVSYVPVEFLFAVILLSVIVGMTTGYIPSRRANKISALNALRYE